MVEDLPVYVMIGNRIQFRGRRSSTLTIKLYRARSERAEQAHKTQVPTRRNQSTALLVRSFSPDAVVAGEFNIITRREFVPDCWWKSRCPGFAVKQVGKTVFGIFGEFIVVADSRVCRDAVSLFHVDCLPHTLSTLHGMCLRLAMEYVDGWGKNCGESKRRPDHVFVPCWENIRSRLTLR